MIDRIIEIGHTIFECPKGDNQKPFQAKDVILIVAYNQKLNEIFKIHDEAYFITFLAFIPVYKLNPI